MGLGGAGEEVWKRWDRPWCFCTYIFSLYLFSNFTSSMFGRERGGIEKDS